MDFEAYAGRRRAVLVRSAVLLGCTLEDAEDLVQTTLTKCLRHWRRVEQAKNVDAYVHRIMVNALADARARRWRAEVPTADVPEPEVPDTDLALGLVVRRALLRLSAEHRTVLVLRFYADLSERDVADALDVPIGTVKSRTARALEALSRDQNIERSH